MSNFISKEVPWVICKRCEKPFKLGSSCKCGGVKTRDLGEGAFLIEEEDENIAVIDTE